MHIELVTDIELVMGWFYSDEKISRVGLPDLDLVDYKNGKLVLQTTYSWYKVMDGSSVVSVFWCQPQTPGLTLLHPYLGSKYWGKSEVRTEWGNAVLSYIAKNIGGHKVLIQTPICCKHVIDCATRIGFQVEGYIGGGISWRGQICGLVLLTKFLRSN